MSGLAWGGEPCKLYTLISCSMHICTVGMASYIPCASAPTFLPHHLRPLLHALYNPGIKAAFGMDLDQVKVSKAEAFIRNTVAEMARKGVALPSRSQPWVGPQLPLRSTEDASGGATSSSLPKVHCCKVEEVHRTCRGKHSCHAMFACQPSLPCTWLFKPGTRAFTYEPEGH